MTSRVVVSWSGGKDSSLMLDRLRRDDRYDVVALVTTVDAASQRVSAHGVPFELVRRQATSLGSPLVAVELPTSPSNDAYLGAFEAALAPLLADGVTTIAFGDIFLEDLRAWREEAFARMGWTPVFPLWLEPSPRLAAEFVARGFSAVLCCVDGAHLDRSYVGRAYDDALLASLPAGVDPCGERGEFHTFVYDGPIFRESVRYALGETTHEPGTHGSTPAGLWFGNLRPASAALDRCPLCGGDNACGVVRGASECWCFTQQIPADVLQRVPSYARDVACVCERCVVSAIAP